MDKGEIFKTFFGEWPYENPLLKDNLFFTLIMDMIYFQYLAIINSAAVKCIYINCTFASKCIYRADFQK